MSAVSAYIQSIENKLSEEGATEHTHRPALERLLERLGQDVLALNDPSRVECGAPDFRLRRDGFTIGHVEAKDVGTSLDDAEDTDQLKRYKESLQNLVLTDYLEFRWFVDGEHRMTARLGHEDSNGNVRLVEGGKDRVENILDLVLSHEPEPVDTAKELASRMAKAADMIDGIVVEALEEGEASDILTDLRDVVADALIPDMDKPEKLEDFADMYAQTLAYGLFAARINHNEEDGDFERVRAARDIPKTNPFLRQLFSAITGLDFADEPYIGFVNDLVQLLNHADIDAVLEDFGSGDYDDDSGSNWQDDPVIHFYETFLKEYDPELRRLRGVYYTPTPVVSYITRSLDTLLKKHFDLNGLDDEATFTYTHRNKEGEEVEQEEKRVLVLDPACGTGTFLYHIIDHIRENRFMPDDAGTWSSYVGEHLLPRLFGFERLMAPYAVSHLKLGMQLAGQDLPPEERERWSYDFESGSGDSEQDRLNIYLTDTLANPEEEVKRYPGALKAVSEEAEAAAEVKNTLPILAIVGNPPYSNFGQSNDAPWVSENLMKDWKPRGEKKWNPDDFMKFMRWSEWKLNQSGQGVLAFITSRTYLDGITHRTMRKHLRDTFDVIHLLDLHGDIYEQPPAGVTDENVFDITKGVAIGLFVKTPEPTDETNIHYHELWGERHEKYEFLDNHDVATTTWQSLDQVDRDTCLGNFYFFAPKGFSFVDEYCRHSWSIDDIFEVSGSGVQTDRNTLFKSYDSEELTDRIETFFSPEGTEPPFSENFRVENSTSYDLLGRREDTSFDSDNISRIADSPLNEQWVYYDKDLTSRPAWDVMRNMVQEDNLAIVAPRQSARGEYEHFFLADKLVSRNYLDTAGKYGNGYIFPLYYYPSEEDKATNGGDMFNDAPDDRRPNLSADFVKACKSRWGLDFVSDGTGDLVEDFGPEDVLHYAYAIFHSHTYRDRYEELLRIDFPRLPLTSNLSLLRDLCERGEELIELHLMNWNPDHSEQPGYPEPGSDEIVSRHPKYVAPGETAPNGEEVEKGCVYINEEQYFKGVEPEVWEFHVGGFQVCEKWLKDRKGQSIDSYDEKQHYKNTVATIRRTIRQMDRIDSIIEDYGGWPLAKPDIEEEADGKTGS
jgi:hypothetical protein